MPPSIVGSTEYVGVIWFKTTHDDPQPEVVRQVAEILKSGGVVAYPTETLYGLGADACDPDAVRAVFRIKRRPPDRAVTVIIGELAQVPLVADDFPESARALAAKFWPGPLTLVLPARGVLPSELLAGGKTIGVRVPGSRLCRLLSLELGGPITATSANVSAGRDLLTAAEIAEVLGESLAALIDAGPALQAVPSSVVDCTCNPPRLLREAAVPAEALKQVIPVIETK